MSRIDPTVIKETKYILMWNILLSIIMQAVFLVMQKWDYTVILGNILGASVAVGNFFLMGIGVQKAIEKDEKDSRATMKLSLLYRTLMIIVITVAGIVLECFNTYTVIIPLFFPRIAIAFRQLFEKNKK